MCFPGVGRNFRILFFMEVKTWRFLPESSIGPRMLESKIVASSGRDVDSSIPHVILGSMGANNLAWPCKDHWWNIDRNQHPQNLCLDHDLFAGEVSCARCEHSGLLSWNSWPVIGKVRLETTLLASLEMSVTTIASQSVPCGGNGSLRVSKRGLLRIPGYRWLRVPERRCVLKRTLVTPSPGAAADLASAKRYYRVAVPWGSCPVVFCSRRNRKPRDFLVVAI